MIGRTLSVVTLTEGALSGNFLKVELAAPREANQMVDVKDRNAERQRSARTERRSR